MHWFRVTRHDLAPPTLDSRHFLSATCARSELVMWPIRYRPSTGNHLCQKYESLVIKQNSWCQQLIVIARQVSCCSKTVTR